MRFGVFNIHTGIAEQSIDCASADDPILELNNRPDHVMLPCDDISDYYYANGSVHSKGAPPSEYHKFAVSTGWTLDVSALEYGLRKKRKKLLDECDWTQLPDVPLETKTAWQNYRQLLRDITDQAGWPETVEWPLKPS